MKNRSLIFIILQSVAIVVLISVIVWPKLGISPGKKAKTELESAAVQDMKLEVENIKSKIDKKGINHLIMEDKINVVHSLNNVEDSSRRVIDSLLDVIGVKDKELSHYVSYTASLRGSLLKASKSDTGYYYRDKWAELQYIPAKDTISPGHFNLKYDLELNYAEYWKKSGIFSSRKNYIDLWSSDPRATINGVKRVKIQPKQKSIIGLDATAMYLNDPYVGGELNYKKDRLNVSGGYLYNYKSQNWYPIIRLNYSIIEF